MRPISQVRKEIHNVFHSIVEWDTRFTRIPVGDMQTLEE